MTTKNIILSVAGVAALGLIVWNYFPHKEPEIVKLAEGTPIVKQPDMAQSIADVPTGKGLLFPSNIAKNFNATTNATVSDGRVRLTIDAMQLYKQG